MWTIPSRIGAMAALGDLERAVMDHLWASTEPQTVRQVHESLAADRALAYTTVMTVLDRLAKKEMVSRERGGRAVFLRGGAAVLGSGSASASGRRGARPGQRRGRAPGPEPGRRGRRVTRSA